MSEGFNPNAWRLQVVGLANPQAFPQYTDNIAYETAMDNNSEMKMTSELHENQDAKVAPNAPMPPPATMDRAAASQMPMPGLLLTLDDIKSLPRVEMTTELKCIEGWSTVVNWAGARFSDFIVRFSPATRNGSQPDLSRAGDFVRYVSMVTPDGGYYVGMDMPSILHPQTLLAYEMNGEPLTLQHGAPLRLVTPMKYGIKQIKRIGRISFTDERPADYWGERGYDWYSGH
ncbi:MAG: molybdopterin-dependent oxidoreductase [Acidobacteria bacterium]|nr:molybdopterin-dependent oxidoreductase [Acidobacteriota bacterium]MBA4183195.1 molybdopterin-dependent oxidoreductase [Acidobacteriota bacterium]